MMKKRIWALLALGLFSVQAMALTLNEARQQGRVGETQSGYIAALKQDKETMALVQNINQARSQSYQQLAETNNIPVDDVAKLAGKKLIAKAQPGEYVQGLNGKWVRK
ncbi:YdbL family protein [Pseudocitrobacter sp. 2023EL-00150]|uniref:YdbL family protein n=2 Tax=unclassified Pseudocitrobacter TaxID=2638778 RepID=UPI0023E3B7FE|nr:MULTISPECIES: YdbL family protein [unclassified Pseudocitrobacter]MDF3828969.1 YdbL family protein [Pseudocitrobacter sp. 2023EL-00150]MEC5374748.1 YdbL family protein [Pseudocitrobacter sp. MW920760]